MGLTWNDINELIQQNPILQFAAEQIKSLGIEWLHSIYQKGKARTVDEELVLCLEYALESFSKRFALEYDDAMALRLMDELKIRRNLSHNNWMNILESVTGLQFDDNAVESWRDTMDRMISEKRLVVLRDYIELRRGRNKHINRAYMHPVIKEVVKRTVEPKRDAAVLLLKSLTDEIPYKENPDFEYSMQIISFIEAVLPNIEVVQPELLARAFYHISLLYGQFNYNEKALFYIEKCINLLNFPDDQKELLGCAYNYQGFLYYFEYKDQLAETSLRIHMIQGRK